VEVQALRQHFSRTDLLKFHSAEVRQSSGRLGPTAQDGGAVGEYERPRFERRHWPTHARSALQRPNRYRNIKFTLRVFQRAISGLIHKHDAT